MYQAGSALLYRRQVEARRARPAGVGARRYKLRPPCRRASSIKWRLARSPGTRRSKCKLGAGRCGRGGGRPSKCKSGDGWPSEGRTSACDVSRLVGNRPTSLFFTSNTIYPTYLVSAREATEGSFKMAVNLYQICPFINLINLVWNHNFGYQAKVMD